MSLELSDLHRVVSLLRPVIHPDGDGGVVVHKTAKPDGSGYCTRILWIAPGERRFLTNGPDDGAPAFDPDGRALWFVRTQDRVGQVYRLSLSGGEAQPVGPRWQGLSLVIPLPDGRAVVLAKQVVPRDLPEAVWPRHYRRWQWQFDGAGYFEVPTRPFLLVGGDEVQLLDDSPYDVALAALSPDGHRLVYSRIADEVAAEAARPDLFMVDLDGAAPNPTRLTHGPVACMAPAWGADGTVWFYGDDRAFGPATVGRLYHLSPDATPAAIPFAEEWAVGATLSSDTHVPPGPSVPQCVGDRVYGLATWHGRTSIWQRSASGQGPEQLLATAVPVVYECSAVSTPKGDALLYVGASPTALDAVYLRRGDAEVVLTDDNDWAVDLLSPTREVTVAAPDGTAIAAYVTGLQPGVRRPAILYVHGGPHGAYGLTPRFDSQVMAGDYAVVQVNPRGSMGYGQAFQNAVRGDWGGADMADLMAVLDALVASGEIDDRQLYVTGGSYGGFMTSWIVGHSHRFRAASAAVPVTNLVSFYGTSDIGWWFASGEVGVHLWDDPKRLWEQSPLAHAPHIRTPTQVVAGEDDRRCPIEQAEQLYTALKHFGVETEFLRYPGPHGFGSVARPTLRQDRLRRLLDWFHSHR